VSAFLEEKLNVQSVAMRQLQLRLIENLQPAWRLCVLWRSRKQLASVAMQARHSAGWPGGWLCGAALQGGWRRKSLDGTKLQLAVSGGAGG